MKPITVAWQQPASQARINYPERMRPDDKTLIDARSPEEYRNVANQMIEAAKIGRISCAADDMVDDLKKVCSLLDKHAKEFGIEAIAQAMTKKANEVVASTTTVFVRSFKGEVQLMLGSDQEKGYAVVDLAMQVRGCYGHGEKAGGWEKCLMIQAQETARRDQGIARDRSLLSAWITVFEKTRWSTGDAEICSTLMNISDVFDDDPVALTLELAADLRRALKTSRMLMDEEIMWHVRAVAENYPAAHWWWRPEEL